MYVICTPLSVCLIFFVCFVEFVFKKVSFCTEKNYSKFLQTLHADNVEKKTVGKYGSAEN